MIEQSEVNQNNFETLLSWLAPDREIAGQKYEAIRTRLIKIFYARGCCQAEEMADKTIEIVTSKVHSLCQSYEGDPALYFYAVAKKVFLDFSRQPKVAELPDTLIEKATESEKIEADYECLEKCLQHLTLDQHEFIINYYQNDKQAKLEQRKKMEQDLIISNQLLRIRAFRIRKRLQKCVLRCLKAVKHVTF